MINYKQAVKGFKDFDWELVDNLKHVVVLSKGHYSVLIDKNNENTVGYMVTEVRDFNEVVTHGELADIMDIANIDKKYGKQT